MWWSDLCVRKMERKELAKHQDWVVLHVTAAHTSADVFAHVANSLEVGSYSPTKTLISYLSLGFAMLLSSWLLLHGQKRVVQTQTNTSTCKAARTGKEAAIPRNPQVKSPPGNHQPFSKLLAGLARTPLDGDSSCKRSQESTYLLPSVVSSRKGGDWEYGLGS